MHLASKSAHAVHSASVAFVSVAFRWFFARMIRCRCRLCRHFLMALTRSHSCSFESLKAKKMHLVFYPQQLVAPSCHFPDPTQPNPASKLHRLIARLLWLHCAVLYRISFATDSSQAKPSSQGAAASPPCCQESDALLPNCIHNHTYTHPHPHPHVLNLRCTRLFSVLLPSLSRPSL